MKYLLPIALLIASVAADVSHLNNEYLPPSGGGASHHHHHHQAEYAEQTNEVPQFTAADSFNTKQLAEPSNDLSQDAAPQEAAPQASGSSLIGSAIFPRLQPEDIRIDQEASAPQGAAPQESAPQAAGSSLFGSAIFPSPSQAEDIPNVPEASAPQEAQAEQQQETAQFNFQDQPEEQQPAAAEFVPKSFGEFSEQGPAAPAEQPAEEQYEAAASSSGIDTQYGSNGGYVY